MERTNDFDEEAMEARRAEMEEVLANIEPIIIEPKAIADNQDQGAKEDEEDDSTEGEKGSPSESTVEPDTQDDTQPEGLSEAVATEGDESADEQIDSIVAPGDGGDGSQAG